MHCFFYHHPCSDGMMCHAIASHYYPDRYEFHGVAPGKTLIDEITRVLSQKTYESITLADLAVTLPIIELLESGSTPYVIIDHHEDTSSLIDKTLKHGKIIYDKKHCGCVLTWNYLVGGEVPRAARLIQIRDLWKWNDPEYMVNDAESDEARIEYIYSVLDLSPLSYMHLLEVEVQSGIDVMIGRTLIEMRNRNIQRIMSSQGYIKDRIYFCQSTMYKSEIGAEATKKYGNEIDFALIWSYDNDNMVHISLRSDGKFNVHEEAKKRFGGGGHTAAAGATIKLSEFVHLLT